MKGKKGKGAKNTGSADLQLAGVLHIMKLLGAPASTEADAAPVASPGDRRKSGTTKIEERPLQPEVVGHIVDALFDRCPHLLGGVVEDIAGFSKVWDPGMASTGQHSRHLLPQHSERWTFIFGMVCWD